MSYYNVGRTEDSILQFQDIAVLNPDNVEVQEILENLRAGNPPVSSSVAVTQRETLPVEEI